MTSFHPGLVCVLLTSLGLIACGPVPGDTFELQAIHVSDPAERLDVLRFRGYDPVPAGIAVFRFEPRP